MGFPNGGGGPPASSVVGPGTYSDPPAVGVSSAWAKGDHYHGLPAAPAGPTIASFDTTVLTKLSLAPVAYWKLNDPVGSSTAADSSGNGYTLTASGTVTFGEPSVVPSDSETSAASDGSTGYLITSSAPAKLPVGASAFTWICCANPAAGLASALMGLAGQSASTGLGWPGGLPSPGNGNQFGIWNPTTGGNAGVSLGTAGGHLFGLSYDGYTAMMWMDGKPEPFQVGNNWNGRTTFGTVAGNVIVLAGGSVGGANPGVFNYSICDVGRVAIFAGVLTPKDWALLMQAFTGV